MIEVIALIISMMALVISLHILLFDRVRLKITSVIPGISGSRSSSDGVWKHSISSIIVKNETNITN